MGKGDINKQKNDILEHHVIEILASKDQHIFINIVTPNLFPLLYNFLNASQLSKKNYILVG